MAIAFTSKAGIAFLPVLLLLLLPRIQADDREFVQTLQPFFKEHCIKCHGPEKEKGDLRIDKLSASLDDFESIEHFQNILDEITIDSMPPEDEPRPDKESLATIVPVLTEHLKKAREKHSSGGGKPVRRFSRTEYINTIYDLLGVHVTPRSLPEDGAIGKFDTEAASLYTTDMHFETALAVSRNAVRRFIASRSEKPGVRQLKALPPPGINKGKFSIRARDVPPAGHQIIRLSFWLTDPKSRPAYFGPGGEALYQTGGTRDAPKFIERKFTESVAEGWNRGNVSLGELQVVNVVNPQPYEFFAPLLAQYGDDVPDSAAPHIIGHFAKLMNRGREVDGKTIPGLHSIFLLGREQGQPFWEAIVEPMALSMCSLESMFHFENRDPERNTRYISAIELANRLSYFLWRSAPDTELFKLAQAGDIYEPEIRNQQIERMMNDEKFDRFLRDFTIQWLELDRQDLIAVQRHLFQDFNDAIHDSMKEETYHFMSHVIRENLPLSNLIDSDFVVVDDIMARHYGLSKAKGEGFQKIALPEDSRRGGLLGQAGILMQTGTGERTSIVERGVFVARKLLNAEPPPPPPLVDDLPTDGVDFKRMSAAELVSRHREAAQCASCHNKIDPLGMGLEEFDAVGLFRTVDKRLNPEYETMSRRERRRAKNVIFEVKLETEGQVFNGPKFKGVEGLKKELMKNQRRLAETYTEALLTFANGRKVGLADEATVEDIINRTSRDSFPARAILKAVVESKAFKTQ